MFQFDTNVEEEWRTKDGSRWEKIKKLIKVDLELDAALAKELWDLLENYADVFAWNKGELGCCVIREHIVDTHGFPPCRTSPNRLSFWDETKVN
jgi:hypothetical protein